MVDFFKWYFMKLATIMCITFNKCVPEMRGTGWENFDQRGICSTGRDLAMLGSLIQRRRLTWDALHLSL